MMLILSNTKKLNKTVKLTDIRSVHTPGDHSHQKEQVTNKVTVITRTCISKKMTGKFLSKYNHIYSMCLKGLRCGAKFDLFQAYINALEASGNVRIL